MAKLRKCLCCQSKYSYCPDCNGADKLKPSYFATFCSEDCKTLWDSMTKFNFGTITKTEAKSIISTIELKPVETYAACIQRDLNNVMTEEPKPKRSRKAVEPKPIEEPVFEFVFESEPVLEPTDEFILEPVVEETTVHEVIKEENE